MMGGGVFLRKPFHIGHDPDAEDHRDYRVGIVHQPYRNVEEIHRFPGGYHVQPGGVQQRTGQGHGQHGIAFKLDGRAVGQQHRHKIEGGVGHKVQDLVGGAGIGQAAQYQDGQHGLDHTAADQGGNHRGEGGGDNADDPVDDRRLFLRLGVGRRGTAGGRAAHFIDEGAVGDGHIVAHDHLELASLFHYADDPGRFFDGFGVHLAAVVEFKPQPGGAVRQFADVVFSSHQGQKVKG